MYIKEYNGIIMDGELVKPIFKNCLHLDISKNVNIFEDIKFNKNRLFLKLNKNTNELKISNIPYDYISFIK